VTDAPPDYTTMTGAEFQRAVGTDPAKWAYACLARWPAALDRWPRAAVEATDPPPPPGPEQVERLADWFANAMDAARKDRIGRALGLDEGPNG
jgi:hypothetical protein